MRKIAKEMQDLAARVSVSKDSGTAKITQIRSYRLITPLFGGGLRARENDVSKLIRETSVRGQLRFWWRALRGTGELDAMRQREKEIFGGGGANAQQSQVSVVVTVDKTGSGEKVFEANSNNPKALDKWAKVAYAAFALQPTRDDPQQREIRVGVEFTLKIAFPETMRADITAALWAWETFGGIGGRTRRGFGALEVVNAEENGKPVTLNKYRQATVTQQLKDDLKKHTLADRPAPANFPRLLANAHFRTQTANDTSKAWELAVEKLRHFRQFRRNKDYPHQELKYGKSQWPESQAIQALNRNRNTDAFQKFPRAVFGLPIIFHFLDKMKIPDYELNLFDAERLASPLLLRPLMCADGAVALAVVLDAPRATSMKLEISGRNSKEVSAILTDSDARQLTANGLTPLNRQTDVLQAFLDFFAADDNRPQQQNRRPQPNNQRRNYR